MWKKLNQHAYLHRHVLLYYQEGGHNYQEGWRIGEVTTTGISRQWIPEQAIEQENHLAAIAWGESILKQRYASRISSEKAGKDS